jgi:hypothetical protein
MCCKKAIIVTAIMLILSACGASESQIATAIAMTEQAAPSDTPNPTSTSEPTSTFTPIPSPTFTLTPTPDTRVISENPNDLILELSEMPVDGKFYLAYSTPHRNWEVINVRGIEDGTKYVEKTGRIDAWILEYDRGTISSRYPPYVVLNPVLYKSSLGSEYVMHENNGPCVSDDGKMSKIEQLDIGDEAYLCLWKEMTSSGKYHYEYVVYFRYRNVFFGVYGGGYEDVFDKEKVIEIAELQMERLSSFPLQSEVTFSP